MKRWPHDAWKILDLPTPDQIHVARQWLWTEPDEAVPGFYLESPEGSVEQEYCYEHAIAHQRYLRRYTPAGKKRIQKADVYLGRMDGEEDNSRWCGHRTCSLRLRVTLTSYGVDTALGLTENDPMDCCIDARDLIEADGALDDADERRKLWYHHVLELQGDHVFAPGPGHDPGDV